MYCQNRSQVSTNDNDAFVPPHQSDGVEMQIRSSKAQNTRVLNPILNDKDLFCPPSQEEGMEMKNRSSNAHFESNF